MKELEKNIIKWRRDLHMIPEIGLELPNTVKYVSSLLDSFGIKYHYLVNGNAIVAIIEGDSKGKTVAFRADMDALPIKENTGLEFASKNENMHACGHDGHTAMLLGAAKYFSENKDKIKGNIKLLFQPGEEKPGGAKPMIDEGALNNPKVDAIFGIHEGNILSSEKENIFILKDGPMMAATDALEINIKGYGTHAASPHTGIDSVLCASKIIIALQSIVSREIDPTENAVITIGTVKAGEANNIIPDTVKLSGTVRTFNKDIRVFIRKRIKEISSLIAKANRCTVEINHKFSYPCLINNIELTNLAMKSAKKISNNKSRYMDDYIMGGDDMAYFLEEVPGTYILLHNPGKIDGVAYSHHNPKFDIDESKLIYGTKLFIDLAIEYLKNN